MTTGLLIDPFLFLSSDNPALQSVHVKQVQIESAPTINSCRWSWNIKSKYSFPLRSLMELAGNAETMDWVSSQIYK